MTTTENPKIVTKFLKTVELSGTSETRKTSKVQPYTIPTVIKKERKIKVRKSEAVYAYALASIINCRVFMYHTVQGLSLIHI